MITKNASAAYATKGNILYPGPATEAAKAQVAAATAANEAQYGVSVLGGSAAIGTQALPSVDSGDLFVVSNGESTVYNQRADY
jgi:hypothetical protein